MNRTLCRVALVFVSAAWPRPAVAQPVTTQGGTAPTGTSAPVREQESSAGERATGFAANVKFDGSNSAQGAFVQLIPEIGYDFARWGLTMGLPVESSSVSSTTARTPSHHGIGDAYVSATYLVDSDRVGFSATLSLTAPTGDSTLGLGAGRTTWNWTNHVDHAFTWLAPFLDAGIGNSINSNTSIGLRTTGTHGVRARTITIPTQPYITIGRVARFDAGCDVRPSRILDIGVLAYDTIPSGDQTALSRFVPNARGNSQLPVSRSIRGHRFFEVNAVTQGDAQLTRDSGFGGSVAVDPTRYLDVSFNYSHSVPMRLDVLSVSVTTSLTRWSRKAP